MYNEEGQVKDTKIGFSNRFYMLVASGSVSRAGTTAFSVYILWITLAITGSALLAGLADGFYTFPLIFSFYFGALIDRKVRKKGIMAGAGLMRVGAIMLVLAAILIHEFLLVILLIYSGVIITGIMSDIQNSIRSAWIKAFLKEEQYQRGTSFLNALTSIAEGIGFAVSGIMIYFGYIEAVILLSLISVISLIPVVLIKEDSIAASDSVKWNVRKDMLEAVSFIRKSRSLLQLIILMIFANFVIAMIGIGFTFTVEKVLDVSAFYLSLIFVALFIGIASGSIPGGSIRGTLGPVVSSLLGVIGAIFIIVSYVDNALILASLVFGIGFSIGIINSTVQTVLIRKVPVTMMARIMGAFNTFALSATFLSGTIAGAIIEFFTIRSLFLIIGIASIVVAAMVIFMKDFSRERIEHVTENA